MMRVIEDLIRQKSSSSTVLFQVYCDQKTDGGGWIVFQRRQDGSVDFYRSWQDYKKGFGSLTGEFWLGNDKIHNLLAVHSNNELRIDLEDFDGNTAYAIYRNFKVGSESENYVLTVDEFSGTAGDSLRRHNRQQFSTKDRDNDQSKASSCAVERVGAWWYSGCTDSNLNGAYTNNTNREEWENIFWYYWKGTRPMKFTEMKFRKVD